MELLTREQFKESVFKRDHNKCVFCMLEAVDAHHIMDRKLFHDGGYYLDNGASLCSKCHYLAETNWFLPDEIRKFAHITNVILPEQLYSGLLYNKWGHAYLNGEFKQNIPMKYPRTYHFPFSPGTTSDDRINHEWWSDLVDIPEIIVTEKLDGQNNCLNQYGVFARSHATPSAHPWDKKLVERWELIKNDLGDLEIFGENMYAIHSIEYQQLTSDFYVFAIRDGDVWLSWENVQFYAAMLDLPTVPVIDILPDTRRFGEESYKFHINNIVHLGSRLTSIDASTKAWCTMEGVVVRNANEFTTSEFKQNVFKWVRKGHVKTDEHWTKNWKKADIDYGITY